jgi:cephalosporin hydroxylase
VRFGFVTGCGQWPTQCARIPSGHVFSVDVNITTAQTEIGAADRGYFEDITLVQGDVCDPTLPDRLIGLIPDQSRCFVVEDSAHTYATTSAALRGFARLVPVGGYFVVEDGCVDIDELRASEDWPRGSCPRSGIGSPRQEGSEFAVRRDLERYGLSCHPRGFLQRVAPHNA